MVRRCPVINALKLLGSDDMALRGLEFNVASTLWKIVLSSSYMSIRSIVTENSIVFADLTAASQILHIWGTVNGLKCQCVRFFVTLWVKFDWCIIVPISLNCCWAPKNLVSQSLKMLVQRPFWLINRSKAAMNIGIDKFDTSSIWTVVVAVHIKIQI